MATCVGKVSSFVTKQVAEDAPGRKCAWGIDHTAKWLCFSRTGLLQREL